MMIKEKAIFQMDRDYDEYLNWIIESFDDLNEEHGMYEHDTKGFINDLCIFLDLDNLHNESIY